MHERTTMYIPNGSCSANSSVFTPLQLCSDLIGNSPAINHGSNNYRWE